MLRNQRDDEIPHLFVFSQVLLAISTNDARYATTGTPKPFWSVWSEDGDSDADVQRLINGRLDAVTKRHVYAHREHAAAIQRYFDAQEAAGERLPTAQDRTLYGLLRPERLLNLAYSTSCTTREPKRSPATSSTSPLEPRSIASGASPPITNAKAA
jgi:type I restriction enzyme R subunit